MTAVLKSTSLLELADQLINVLDLDTGLSLGRLGNLEGLESVGNAVKVLDLDHLEGLLLGLHDVGQSHVSRLVESQIGGNDHGQFGSDGLDTTIDLSGDLDLVAVDRHLGGLGGLGPLEQTSENLTGLAVVAVNGLLSENDQVGLLFLNQLLEHLGHTQRLKLGVLGTHLHQSGVVSTLGQSLSQDILGLGGTDGGHVNVLNQILVSLLEQKSLLDSNITEGVDGELDSSGLDAGAGLVDSGLDSEINYSLDGHKDTQLVGHVVCVCVVVVTLSLSEVWRSISRGALRYCICCAVVREGSHSKLATNKVVWSYGLISGVEEGTGLEMIT